ncbi:mesoderm induction early response protein 1 [Condylostylus longicornis]|uniref:mesoderm induction early response protein 1 n=1 Tax=Condylostylus longicornis TaxID=2530218 RepID=UPI00244DC648|nr:mesoderm induction early response protein 1 [Condylostylus longicornis]
MAEELQCPVSPSSSKTSSKDSIFEPTVDMMVNDFDDERTLEEEEAMAAQEQEDPSTELSSLQKESDMPIEELLALYKIPVESIRNPRSGKTSSIKRGTKRRKASSSNNDKADIEEDQSSSKRERKPSIGRERTSDKAERDEKLLDNKESKSKLNSKPSTSSAAIENDLDEPDLEEDDDNILDGEEDESEYEDDDDDSKEESHLKKLYPETYKTGDKRLLRTLSRQQSDEEEDGDYSPDEDEMRKSIMVGSEYQAVIPEGFSIYDDVLPYENEDKLLWDPSRLTEEQIVEFLTKAQEQSKTTSNSISSTSENSVIPPIAGTNLRDDEQALFLLLQCGYNVEEALRRKRINPLPPTDQMSIWSEEECRNFESVIRLYGKDFHTIKHAKVHTRSVGELVQFYYLWKKTERHDVFANKTRLDKKKYSVHPGLTDYMDKFLEELDTANNQNCNSNSSSSVPTDRCSSPSSTSCIGGSGLNSGAGTSSFIKANNTESNTNTTEIEIIPQQNDK